MASSATDTYVVHLDRPRLFVTGLVLLAAFLAIAWWVSPVGLIAVPGALIPLAHSLDPRPQLVLDRDGATFGGLLKSAWGRDVHVPWSEVRDVTLIADQLGEPPRLTKSIPIAPEGLTRLAKRLAPPGKLEVETEQGRRFGVYPPGHGLTLEQVEREFLHQWRAATRP